MHPLGLDVQSQIEVLGGNREKVLRDAFLGIRVEVSTHPRCDLRQLPGRKTRAAAEHHMLLCMRHARKAFRSLVGADLIIHYRSDDGSEPVLHNHDAQPVAQRFAQYLAVLRGHVPGQSRKSPEQNAARLRKVNAL